MEDFFLGGKSIDDNLDPYHVVLTTKAKNRRLLRRNAKEKMSYIARRKVLACSLPRDPKKSASLPTVTVSYVSEKIFYY